MGSESLAMSGARGAKNRTFVDTLVRAQTK